MPTIVDLKEQTYHVVDIGKPPGQEIKITSSSKDKPVPPSSTPRHRVVKKDAEEEG